MFILFCSCSKILFFNCNAANYAQPLAVVMSKMLLVSEVASLAREIEKKWMQHEERKLKSLERSLPMRAPRGSVITPESLSELLTTAKSEEGTDTRSLPRGTSVRTGISAYDDVSNIIDVDDVNPYTGALSSSQSDRIAEILGQWEEPNRGTGEIVSSSD